MSASDAILVGGDWISEHYLTTDATSQSFKAEVLSCRKEWDAAETGTVRSRFTAARADLLTRLAGLEEAPGLADDLRRDLQQVLGYDAIGLTHETTGPLTLVTQHSLPDVAGLALVAATPVDSAEDLLDKDAATLAEPWAPEDGDPVVSVARLLSAVFVDEDGPAFALVLAGRVLLVAEKERWAEGRYLAIDLQLVCERNDTTRAGEVDRALACVSAESLAPDAEGNVWWNRVLEESVKHTVGVSRDLREGVRLSIELISNEVVSRRRERHLEPLPPEEAQPLAQQALRYLYRILFLLYAESSPDLGVLPVGAAEYDQGYSLDRLRELVQVPLTTPRSEIGTHFYDSLGVLFRLVDQGYQPDTEHEDGLVDPLQFRSLRADLFHPEAVAHIDEVGLGNARLQQVLQHLLLSKESRGSDRGFISYAELGINQLGAVYEGLMSYTGRFAETDLYEVAKNADSSKGSWLVPAERAGGIDDKDFVRVEDAITGERIPVLHREGTFVFRLAGRERQQSASYYTPEVLTRFTVGQALEELLDQDDRRTTAEEILSLTVCEPALGSGAFAIEAVRQLAAEYLKRRQEELGEKVDPEAYARELQRVKAYLALHNVYGVDLNATAVELAEISLWLDTMVEGLHAPWFGLHLRRGNSLIGARRAGFTRTMIADKTSFEAVPTGIGARTGLVHHFLLPALGWGSAVVMKEAKDAKELVPEAVRGLNDWRKSVRKRPGGRQLDQLDGLANRVETLWAVAGRRLEIAEQQVRRDIGIWGRKSPTRGSAYVTREQIETSLADPEGAYQRLRRVMDAWCALWFWPLSERNIKAPTLDQWYDALGMIIGRVTTMTPKQAKQGGGLFADIHTWSELADAEHNDRIFAGAKPIAEILAAHPWLSVCERISAQQGFFHWELDFATVFASGGGFDLQVGNPPWVRPRTDANGLLAEADPRMQLTANASQGELAEHRRNALSTPGMAELLIDGTSEVNVQIEYLSDPALFPHLVGLQPDLYRCFMEQTWMHQSVHGVVALIHPESHFTDEKAGTLRAGTYRRLRRHWQFINELSLFEIHHLVTYGVHIYGIMRDTPSFVQATSLYHPDTVERSFSHNGDGDEPGLKDVDGNWDRRPHLDRLIAVHQPMLETWHALIEPSVLPVLQTRMVYSVNRASSSVLAQLATASRIGGLGLEFSRGWDESRDRKAGRFESEWGTPESWRDVILQGPHFHVGVPFYKAPNATMANNLDWSTVDLESLAPDAIPVTSYKPRGDRAKYERDYTHWGDEGEFAARDYYRVAWRAMAANTGERTLIPAIIPPGTAHPHGVTSAGLPVEDMSTVVLAAGYASSLLNDFLIRAVPKSGIPATSFARLAVAVDHPLVSHLVNRVLRLNCLTSAYSGLWAAMWPKESHDDCWAGGIEYPGRPFLPPTDRHWTESSPLRRASDRRQALVEIDAIAALSLGLTADDLCTIYRTQFAVLYGYDRNTYFYDTNGRLVPNSVLTVWRKKGDGISVDDRTATNPSGNTYTYELPFVTLDREADMRQAYAHFEKVLAERGSA